MNFFKNFNNFTNTHAEYTHDNTTSHHNEKVFKNEEYEEEIDIKQIKDIDVNYDNIEKGYYIDYINNYKKSKKEKWKIDLNNPPNQFKNTSINYTEYLAENLDRNIKYTEYLAENLAENISKYTNTNYHSLNE